MYRLRIGSHMAYNGSCFTYTRFQVGFNSLVSPESYGAHRRTHIFFKEFFYKTIPYSIRSLSELQVLLVRLWEVRFLSGTFGGLLVPPCVYIQTIYIQDSYGILVQVPGIAYQFTYYDTQFPFDEV